LLCVSALLLCVLSTSAAAGEIAVEKDIVYGKGGDVDLKLDLARPKEGNGPFPAIVFVHGGGWMGGSRGMHRDDIESAARRGYVAVTIEYRHTDPDKNNENKPRNPWPAQIEDAKCAVRWVRANADKYRVDPKHIGASGGSAGGHLSLMLGACDEKAGFEGHGGNSEQSSRVQAVVNVYGPTDLASAHAATIPPTKKAFEGLFGTTPDEAADAYKAASPVTYLSADDAPILTLHGSDDKVVVLKQAEALDAKAKEAGIPHTLIVLDKQGHGFKGPAKEEAREKMFEFFDKHLKKH
jgi:acetyl esterase/lipase